MLGEAELVCTAELHSDHLWVACPKVQADSCKGNWVITLTHPASPWVHLTQAKDDPALKMAVTLREDGSSHSKPSLENSKKHILGGGFCSEQS